MNKISLHLCEYHQGHVSISDQIRGNKVKLFTQNLKFYKHVCTNILQTSRQLILNVQVKTTNLPLDIIKLPKLVFNERLKTRKLSIPSYIFKQVPHLSI